MTRRPPRLDSCTKVTCANRGASAPVHIARRCRHRGRGPAAHSTADVSGHCSCTRDRHHRTGPRPRWRCDSIAELDHWPQPFGNHCGGRLVPLLESGARPISDQGLARWFPSVRARRHKSGRGRRVPAAVRDGSDSIGLRRRPRNPSSARSRPQASGRPSAARRIGHVSQFALAASGLERERGQAAFAAADRRSGLRSRPESLELCVSHDYHRYPELRSPLRERPLVRSVQSQQAEGRLGPSSETKPFSISPSPATPSPTAAACRSPAA